MEYKGRQGLQSETRWITKYHSDYRVHFYSVMVHLLCRGSKTSSEMLRCFYKQVHQVMIIQFKKNAGSLVVNVIHLEIYQYF